jgi:hypothetical protein
MQRKILMSMTTMLLRRLVAHLAVGALATLRTAITDSGNTNGSARSRATASLPLQWRAPWKTSQLLSLTASTLLAPPFWVVGILLMIDSHSDNPFFWPSLMAIVGIGNVCAIVHANQRHHRRPYTGRMQVALHYLGTSMLVGSVLFLLVGWGTGALQDFSGPMATALPAGVAAKGLWGLILAGSFSLLSFAHACVLHAWFAFETPLPQRPSRGKGPL